MIVIEMGKSICDVQVFAIFPNRPAELLRFLFRKADSVKPSIELDLNIDFPVQFQCGLFQHFKLPEAAQRNDQLSLRRFFDLPVQRKAHNQHMAGYTCFPKLYTLRSLRNGNRVNAAVPGQKLRQPDSAEAICISLQNRNQFCLFPDFFSDFQDVICNRMQIDFQIRIRFHYCFVLQHL